MLAPLIANGAMGLGLQMWPYEVYWPYVVVTVVFEALFIGRWAGMTLQASLIVSALANAFTAFLGALFAVFLKGVFVGTASDPNPVLNAAALLAGMGFVSCLVEGAFWSGPVRKVRPGSGLLFRLFAAHAIGVPLGMAILSLPERPYQGLEATVGSQRIWKLRTHIKKMNEFLMSEEAVPAQNALETLAEASGATTDELGLYLRKPVYTRFSTGDGPAPIEFNPRWLGQPFPPSDSLPAEEAWILRSAVRGFAVEAMPDGLRIASSPSQ